MPSKLVVDLVRPPSDLVTGIYKVGDNPAAMPNRLRMTHVDAIASFLGIAHIVVVSDMFRSPESSLKAVREGRGAQPPSFSAHNYGLAIDISVDKTRKRLAAVLNKKTVTKTELDWWMKESGWICHRTDHLVAFESWHYNYLPEYADKPLPKLKVTSGLIEKELLRRFYGEGWKPSPTEMQELLAELKLYHGEIDGIIGPRSKEAIRAFQRTWGLKDTGVADIRTLRTLYYVTATINTVDAANGTMTTETGVDQ